MLALLVVMPDSDIDYSDIPPGAPDAKWVRAGIHCSVMGRSSCFLKFA
jgi:hypothetical protein